MASLTGSANVTPDYLGFVYAGAVAAGGIAGYAKKSEPEVERSEELECAFPVGFQSRFP